MGEGFLKWACFKKCVEDDNSYVLYTSPYFMYIFPKNVMDEGERAMFEGYLKRYNVDG